MASPGTAATSIFEDQTACPQFKVSIRFEEGAVRNMVKNQKVTTDLFRTTTLILWKECHMIRRKAFQVVDETLNNKCSKYEPFNGTLIVTYV